MKEHEMRMRYLALAQEARLLMDVADQARGHLMYATAANLAGAFLVSFDLLRESALWGTLAVWGYFFAAAVWRQHLAHRAIVKMAESGGEL